MGPLALIPYFVRKVLSSSSFPPAPVVWQDIVCLSRGNVCVRQNALNVLVVHASFVQSSAESSPNACQLSQARLTNFGISRPRRLSRSSGRMNLSPRNVQPSSPAPRLGANPGPFRLVAPHEKRPARWVRMLKSIAVVCPVP
jgi:hypothetical protein